MHIADCLKRFQTTATAIGGGNTAAGMTMYQDNQSVCAMLTKLTTKSLQCQPVITEIAWLLAIYNVELDIRYIRSELNVVADMGSRWRSGSVTQSQYKTAIKDHFIRKRIPQTMKEAKIHKSKPLHPELLGAMDIWTSTHDGNIAQWFPPDLFEQLAN